MHSVNSHLLSPETATFLWAQLRKDTVCSAEVCSFKARTADPQIRAKNREEITIDAARVFSFREIATKFNPAKQIKPPKKQPQSMHGSPFSFS
jgi:hypothetical protein